MLREYDLLIGEVLSRLTIFLFFGVKGRCFEASVFGVTDGAFRVGKSGSRSLRL